MKRVVMAALLALACSKQTPMNTPSTAKEKTWPMTATIVSSRII